MAIRALENAFPFCLELEAAQASECEYRMGVHILFLGLTYVDSSGSLQPRVDAANMPIFGATTALSKMTSSAPANKLLSLKSKVCGARPDGLEVALERLNLLRVGGEPGVIILRFFATRRPVCATVAQNAVIHAIGFLMH
jgi:hypothetical protein